jgi:hypothetical protein
MNYEIRIFWNFLYLGISLTLQKIGQCKRLVKLMVTSVVLK